MLDAIEWKKLPFCWLNADQQTELKCKSEIRQYQMGEKIWSQETGKYQFFIIRVS